jgi:hypothetical protein
MIGASHHFFAVHRKSQNSLMMDNLFFIQMHDARPLAAAAGFGLCLLNQKTGLE